MLCHIRGIPGKTCEEQTCSGAQRLFNAGMLGSEYYGRLFFLHLEAVIRKLGWRLELFTLSSSFHGDLHMTKLLVWQQMQARNSKGALRTAKTMAW